MKTRLLYSRQMLWTVGFYKRWGDLRHSNTLRVLSAHRVIDRNADLSPRDREDLARGCLSLQEFEERVAYLSKRYCFMGLAEVVELIRTGKQLPRNALVLTFDDAYQDVCLNAGPVLKDHDIPYAVFLTTGYVDEDPMMMTKEQIAEMADDSRITWGAHGVTHRPLTDLSPEELKREIEVSRDDVRALTGISPTLFCYPDGKWNEDVVRGLRDQGFIGACATGRTVNCGRIDPYAIERIPFESEPMARFAFRVAGRAG